jgi:WD40 repeat-containing protein SMU1
LQDACTSSKGRYVFAAGSDSVLYCFEVSSGELVHAIKMHKGEVTAVAHHPHINVLASISVDSTLKLWRP